MTATNIDDVIAMCGTDIPVLSYGGVDSLKVQMGLWNVGMYGSPGDPNAGIFPPKDTVGREFVTSQRPVSDWSAASELALADIEGPGVGQSGPVGTSACVDAVMRAASAVKYATIAGQITAAQQTAVVALYNLVWT